MDRSSVFGNSKTDLCRKRMWVLICIASMNIGDLQPSGIYLSKAVYSKTVNTLMGLYIYIRTLLSENLGPPLLM